MTKEKLIYNINGKDYLLVSLCNVGRCLSAELDKIGAIYQGVKDIKPEGLMNSKKTIENYLIPFDRIKEYNSL